MLSEVPTRRRKNGNPMYSPRRPPQEGKAAHQGLRRVPEDWATPGSTCACASSAATSAAATHRRIATPAPISTRPSTRSSNPRKTAKTGAGATSTTCISSVRSQNCLSADDLSSGANGAPSVFQLGGGESKDQLLYFLRDLQFRRQLRPAQLRSFSSPHPASQS